MYIRLILKLPGHELLNLTHVVGTRI